MTIFIVSGPSGAGKSTLVSGQKSGIKRIQSYTTRPVRNGDDTRVYYHLTKEEFKRMEEKDAFLETTVSLSGHLYGTPKEAVEKALSKGENIILEIDTKGFLKVVEIIPPSLRKSIFIAPPNANSLFLRLLHRSSESLESLFDRVAGAKKEMEYVGMYDFVIINDNLQKAISEMERILAGEQIEKQQIDVEVFLNDLDDILLKIKNKN